MKANARDWAKGLLVLIVLLALMALAAALGPHGLKQYRAKPAMARYIHSGQLQADLRTVKGMLTYLFESEAPACTA